MRPFDKNMLPVENYPVTYFSLGEGYHNFHHVFPFDYSASEFGWAHNFNLTTAFIDFFELIGQVYDKRVADPSTVDSRSKRTGDRKKPVKHYIIEYIIGMATLLSWLWFPLILRYFFMRN